MSPLSNHYSAVARSKQPVTDYCEFRKFHHYTTWTFYGEGKKLKALAYGETPRNQAIRRCPRCNKRLKLRARFCTGGEFIVWELPEHKPRQTRQPGPRRQSRTHGRGK